MAKDFQHRVVSASRAGATTSGFGNDFVHLSGSQSNYPVTDKGGYSLMQVVIGTAPTASVNLKIGNDVFANIDKSVTGSLTFRAYLYDQLFYSGDADITFILSKNI